MDRRVFTYGVARPDAGAAKLVGRLRVLWRSADDDSLKQTIDLAKHAALSQRHMAFQPSTVAHSNIVFDDAKRASFYARRECGGRADNRKTMNGHARRTRDEHVSISKLARRGSGQSGDAAIRRYRPGRSG